MLLILFELLKNMLPVLWILSIIFSELSWLFKFESLELSFMISTVLISHFIKSIISFSIKFPHISLLTFNKLEQQIIHCKNIALSS